MMESEVVFPCVSREALSQGSGHVPGDVGRDVALVAPTLAMWLGGRVGGQASGEIDKLMAGGWKVDGGGGNGLTFVFLSGP